MRERPIIFSGPMVRTILAGEKTQTRCMVKFPDDIESVHCPYGYPGNQLWIRETWRSPVVDGRKPRPGDSLVYRADLEDDRQRENSTPSQKNFTWLSASHMPRWASRVTLEITEVRVERVNEISEADALAEGIPKDPGDRYLVYLPKTLDTSGLWRNIPVVPTAIEAFAANWDDIHKRVALGCLFLDAPYVWSITFKLVMP